MRVVRGVLRAARVLLIAVPVGLVLAFLLLCLSVDRFGRSDGAAPADVIVILGAQVLADGEPGPDLLPRTEKAVALYRQGYAPHIICAGGYAGDAASAAAVACRTAVRMGVPADAVFIADGSNNTREDAQRSTEIMQAQGWRRAIVVSHPLHLLRAALRFWAADVEVYPSPTSTVVDDIPAEWRIYYAGREAGLIVLDLLYPEGEIGDWAYTLRRWLGSLGLEPLLDRAGSG